jgi:DNA-binding winged helix-turn-helix (wHTH) protein/Tol biopolymer transport system component
MPAASSVHDFGLFRLDSAERLLLRAGQPVSLTPKAFDLLVYLVDHAGRLVTKQALMSAMWPNSFVEEANLTFTVSALRKALGDGQDGEQFIQTVPTRGYRFVAPVTHHEIGPALSTSETPARSFKPLVRQVATIALVVAVVAMLPVVVRHLREKTDVAALARFTIPAPESTPAISQLPMATISPDGRRVALIAATGSRIWLRNIDGLAALPIAGTDGTRSLCWAPDSQQLAFTTTSELKTLKVSDGTIQRLCDSCQPTGGVTWSNSGMIVFTTLEGLASIPAAGGRTQPVTTLDRSRGEISHLYPHFLPDGVRFLYVRRNKDDTRSGLYLGQIDSEESRLLLGGDLPAIYAAPGYLLFLRGGTLMVQRFDSSRLTLSGEASSLLPAALGNPLVGQPTFSASETGVLTHTIVERAVTQFQWVGRGGALQQLVGEPGRYYTFDLTADASRLVFARIDEAGDASLWSFDLARGLTTPLTFGTSFLADPRWMADGQEIMATRWRPLPQSVIKISRDGLESTLSISGDGNMVEDVSRDGQYLLYRQRAQQLLAISLNEGSKPFLVHKAPAGGINQSQFSPDSQWIAYHSNESGRFEVYVTPFPPGERSQVSPAGGVQPVWRQDGRELYYLGLDGTLNAIEVEPGARPQFSTPRALFRTGIEPAPNVEQYAASRDGQRFLFLKVVDDRNRSSIGVVLNWPALLTASPSR